MDGKLSSYIFLFFFLVLLPSEALTSPPAPTETPGAARPEPNPATVHDDNTGNLVLIPAGKFMSGPPEALEPRFLKAFRINKYEVTQAEFERVMGRNPSAFKGADRPVEKVDWFEANDYCRKLGQRLPNEWEWEKAAKGGTVTRYFWGGEKSDGFAWHKGNADKKTHPVGQKKPNGFGLYDTSGNVWEWTSSLHENGGKVLRGGSWRNSPSSLRSSHRILSLPIFRYHYVGFRCAVSESPPP